MIKKNSKVIRFKVVAFLTRDGVETSDWSEATVAACSAEGGKWSMPLSKRVLGDEVKIGDEFTETTEISPC